MFIYEVKKDDCKLQILVSIRCSGGAASCTVEDIRRTQKGKRKPISISAQVRDTWEYRRRGYDERGKYVKEQYLKYCTEEDIESAIQYAYSMIKPTLENVAYRAT